MTKAKEIERPAPVVEPIAEILGRVGAELDALAEQLNQIQDVIGPLALKASELDPRFLQDAQAIDHIEQKMICLSQFLTSLGPLMQGHWVLDVTEASQAITLSALAVRLRAAKSLTEEDADGVEHLSGEFELF